MRLSDGVVVLRPWAETDYDELARLSRDPQITRWTLVPADNDAAQVRAFAESGAERPFVVEVDGAIAGTIGLKPGAELGYWIAAEHRGRGHAVRAVTLLTELAFAEGAEQVEIRISAGNAASRRVAEKAGFALAEEGELAVYRRSRIASGRDG